MPAFTVGEKGILVGLIQHDVHQGGRLLKFLRGAVLVGEVDEVEYYIVKQSCVGNGSVGYPGRWFVARQQCGNIAGKCVDAKAWRGD